MVDQHIPSSGGRLLESYKNWYLVQPKLMRAFVLPFLIGASVLALEFGGLPPDWNRFIFFANGLLLLPIMLYNQYLDVVAADSIKDVINERNSWRDTAERFIHLKNVLNELVNTKSGMFLEATSMVGDSAEAARSYIRDKNSLKRNVDRIIMLMHKTFEKYADTLKNQKFHVTYLTPSEDGSYLELKSWFNSEREKPPSCDNGNPAFRKDGRTVAVYVWNRDKREPVTIDDVPSYVAERSEDGIFSYTCEREKESLKAIMCYKIEDPELHVCLGVVCVDSNVENTFETLGDQYCKQVVEAYAERIVFEHRFGLMKSALGPYTSATGEPQ